MATEVPAPGQSVAGAPGTVVTFERRSAEPLLRHVVGGILRRARSEQGRTLFDVAAAARVSTAYLSEVERGRKEASSEILAAICRALGIRLVDLLARTQEDLDAAEQCILTSDARTSLRRRAASAPRSQYPLAPPGRRSSSGDVGNVVVLLAA